MPKRLYKLVEFDIDGCIQSEDYIPPGSIVKVDTPEDMRRRIRMKEERERREFLRDSNPFTFIETKGLSTMKPEMLTKIIYLSTYLKFNDSTLMKTERTQLYKQDLPDLLKISSKQCKIFLDETTAAGLLSVNDDATISINTDIFCRRSLKPGMFNRYTRAYAKSIQSLYNSINTRKHRQVGYLFLMLPYLNRNFNVLCHPDDIFEDDAKAIRTISFADFCDLVGYNRHNANALKSAYRKMQFCDKDGKSWDLVRIIDEYGKVYVNPNIFYAGDDLKRVELLDTLFS